MSSRHPTAPAKVTTDPRLSLRARGVFLMLAEHDGDEFTMTNFAESSRDYIGAVSKAIKELEELGYVETLRIRNNGRYAGGYRFHLHPNGRADNNERTEEDHVEGVQLAMSA